jgi:hypothetical protein
MTYGVRQAPARLLKPFSVYVLLVTAAVVGGPVDARSLRRAPKATQATLVKPDAKIPTEQKRDPADIALDRKIKGICRGC